MLDQEAWKFINTFAPWLSAIGTFAAVATSLRLANRDRRVRLSVRAALSVYLNSAGGVGHGAKFVTLTVTNEGRRPATVCNFGWRIGLPYLGRFNCFRLARIEWLWPHYSGPQLPVTLEDGKLAVFLHPLDEFAAAVIDRLAEEQALLPWPDLRFRTMQAIVPTTAGEVFCATMTKELRKELTKRAVAKSKQSK